MHPDDNECAHWNCQHVREEGRMRQSNGKVKEERKIEVPKGCVDMKYVRAGTETRWGASANQIVGIPASSLIVNCRWQPRRPAKGTFDQHRPGA